MAIFREDDHSICFGDVSQVSFSATLYLHDGTSLDRSVESSVSVLHQLQHGYRTRRTSCAYHGQKTTKPTNYSLFGQHLFEKIGLKMFLFINGNLLKFLVLFEFRLHARWALKRSTKYFSFHKLQKALAKIKLVVSLIHLYV